MKQLLTGLSVFFGEFIIISAEMWAARYFDSAKPWPVIIPAFFVSLIGVALLVYGYTVGYQAFKNIWIVTAISIGGILIVEPTVSWLLFHQLPTKGALIAFILGVIGVIVSITVE